MNIKHSYLGIFIVLFLTIEVSAQKNSTNIVEKMYEEYEQEYHRKLIFNHDERIYYISDTIPEAEKEKIKILIVEKKPNYTEIVGLQEFVNLEVLIIRGSFESLPKEVGELRKLRQLTLNGIAAFELDEFFKELKLLPDLRELYLHNLSISELPVSVYELSNLEKLKISDCNNIVSVSEKIDNLENLFYLEVWNTSIIEFPKVKFKNLKALVIGDNAQMKTPDFDSNFNNIEYLVLSNIKLSTKNIKEISIISSLKCIKIFYCNLTRFPYCLSSCPNLSLLMLNFNNIRRISKSLKNFNSLEHLSLQSNPISKNHKMMTQLYNKYNFSISFSILP